jgi:ZipA, C-terminal FtsZ-binding domain
MTEPAHRFEGDYWTRSEWREMPDTARRVRLALGPDPIVVLPHLMPTITLPPAPKPLPPGPHPGTCLLADIADTQPLTREALSLGLQGLDLVGGALWGFQHGEWLRLTPTTLGQRPTYQALTLAWHLLELPGSSLSELAAHVAHALRAAHTLAERLGVAVTREEAPAEAARRAASLVLLKARFARSVELRLLAQGTPFPSRRVWRAAYSLGLGWGHLDLLHWPAAPQRALFTLTSMGKPSYFLPERTAEGESVPGLILSFELPSCPAPLETFDAMALALASLRESLGGLPTDHQGRELDTERLAGERESVSAAVSQLQAAGVVPGSREALTLF